MKQTLLNIAFVSIVGFNVYYWYKCMEVCKEYNNNQQKQKFLHDLL